MHNGIGFDTFKTYSTFHAYRMKENKKSDLLNMHVSKHSQATGPAYTQHAMQRRCERGIKAVYIEMCQNLGTCTSVPINGGENQWMRKHMLYGLHVVSTPPRQGVPSSVITAYWVCEDIHIDSCIAMFDQRLADRSGRKQKHNKTKPKK